VLWISGLRSYGSERFELNSGRQAVEEYRWSLDDCLEKAGGHYAERDVGADRRSVCSDCGS
jgi:hypothetical protein